MVKITEDRLTAEQTRGCLVYDPFAGDRDSHVKHLSDKLRIAAKSNPCCICGGTIVKGEQHRAMSAIVDDKATTARMCFKCCVAAAQSWDEDDAGREIEHRSSMFRLRQGPPDDLLRFFWENLPYRLQHELDPGRAVQVGP